MLRSIRFAAIPVLCTLIHIGSVCLALAQDRRVPSSAAELRLS